MPEPATKQPSQIERLFSTKRAEELIHYAEQLGHDLAQADLSSAQARNVLDSIQAMRRYDSYQLQMLRAKLAYAAGKKRELVSLKEVLDEAITCVHTDADFAFFRDLVEAIVAYHALASSDKKPQDTRKRRSR